MPRPHSVTVAPLDKTVLVVDDQPANLDVLLAHLVDEGVRLLATTSGKDALRLAEEVCPDLVLLDVMMPDLDGYEVLTRLKQSDRTKDIPVVLLSALADQVEEVRGLELGAADYIGKPYSVPVLQARVRKHLAEKTWATPVSTFPQQCTDLLSREEFMEQLVREWDRCQRFGHSLSLLHIQMTVPEEKTSCDDMRQGLYQISRKLLAQVRRASELLACMGHNQFAVLMPELGADQAQDNGLRLLRVMQDVQLPGRPLNVRLHVSIGTATVTPCQGDTIDTFLTMAAGALQKAQQAGGNCVGSS
jgi:diguanylate cyclase (GGDEF)-like protein